MVMNFPIKSGCRVVVELVDAAGEVERRAFTLVPTEQADFKSGLLDENTPLGQALKGRFAGQVLPYRQGDLRQVRILEVERSDGSVSGQAADQRRADVRKAEAMSEMTSQMIFASARGSKWGEYEVNLDKLLEEQQKKKEEGEED
jgi:predicted  nucleic acid-binding Zn-ribbon protein